MIIAHFLAKYGPDRSDTQNMEEGCATQCLTLDWAKDDFENLNEHAASMANGPDVSRLLSCGIFEESGL